MSDDLNQNSDQVSRDSHRLRSSMENALERVTEERATEALRADVRQITGRGADHAQRVFNSVANNVGNNNDVIPNATVNGDSLCFFPPNGRESLDPNSWRDVCVFTDGTTSSRTGRHVRVNRPNASRER